jgi:predicted transcriptional regulator
LLAPDFFEMQTDYLNSMYAIYKDLDASLIVMLLTRKIYAEAFSQDNKFGNKTSLKSFYQEKKYCVPVAKFKIKEISNSLNLPRETIRRKKIKLIKDKFILFNKKKKTYSLNIDKIDELTIKTQIEISSKFLSNYCIFFSQKNTIFEDMTFDSFKNEINKKFLLYLPIFLNFQLSYFSNFKKIADMESLFITLLCALNTTTHIKKKNLSNNKIFNSLDIFAQLPKLKDQYGLNSTSIAEITKLPRTTVLRKLAKLENISLLKRDEFKRYATPEQAKKEYYSTMQQTLKLLGIFISECLEVYTVKDLKVS